MLGDDVCHVSHAGRQRRLQRLQPLRRRRRVDVGCLAHLGGGRQALAGGLAVQPLADHAPEEGGGGPDQHVWPAEVGAQADAVALRHAPQVHGVGHAAVQQRAQHQLTLLWGWWQGGARRQCHDSVPATTLG
jgi:hypothetical protein